MTAVRCLQSPTGAAAAQAARLRASIPRIETARLALRAATVADVSLWARLLSEDGCDMVGGPLTAEEAWSAFCVYVAGWSLHGHGLWAVDRDGELIGFVMLGLEWGDEEPELGYLLASHARGRGYGREAVAAVRDYAVELLGQGAFVSYIDVRNDASARLAEALGAGRDRRAERKIDGAAHVWRYGAEAHG